MLTLKRGRREKVIGIVAVVLLHFMAYGFPIQSFIPFFLNKDSNTFNILFRAVILVTSLLFILISFLRKRPIRFNYGWAFFLCFWFVYTFRLIYDLEFQNLSYLDTDSSYVYSFAFGVCLIPTIGIYTQGRLIDHTLSIKVLFWMLLISNLCLTYSILSFANWSLSGVILSRASVNIEIDGVETSIINPITVGFYGQLLTIASIHLLNFPVFQKKKYRLLLYASIILGLINLTLGASRGPFVILIILLLIEFYLVANRKKHKVLYYGRSFALFFTLILMAGTAINYSGISEDIRLFNRLSQSLEARREGDKEERDYLFESGIRQFLESPLVGDAFVTRYYYLYNSYTHNIILDVLMSLGLLGMLLFGGFLYTIFTKMRRVTIQYPQYGIYIILFFAQFLTSMLSGSLFLSSGFWLMGTLLITLPLPYRKIRISNNANS